MAVLTKPDFKLPSPNTRKTNTTDAVWWFRCHALRLESSTRDAGTYAKKSGFHGKGKEQSASNYSIRDSVNKTGPWWKDMSSAFDWTFTTAQRGDYALIDRYTSRLVSSSLNQSDPRLDLVLYEFFGQADNDSQVEGRNEYKETNVTSDSSHLWHLHFSFLRSKCGDFWGMWAIYTVLIGWTVEQWRASLPKPPSQPPTPPNPPATGLPQYKLGSRVLENKSPDMRGTDVQYVQKWIGSERMGSPDGIAGGKFESGVKWYQNMRGIKADGIVGPTTWRHMGVK